MDVNMNSLKGHEMARNKANTGRDILLKTLEKTEEAKTANMAREPRPVEKTQEEKQGRIDIYA